MNAENQTELRKWAIETALKFYQNLKSDDGEGLEWMTNDLVQSAETVLKFVQAKPEPPEFKTKLAAVVERLHIDVLGCGSKLRDRIQARLESEDLL